MDIVSYLASVAAQLTPSPLFMHGEKSFINLKDDADLTNGCVYVDEPITSNDTFLSTGALEEVYNIAIFFGNKSAFDATPEQNQIIIQAQRLVRQKFVQLMRKDTKNVKKLQEIQSLDTTHLFDTQLTGVYVKFKIILIDRDQNICGQ